MMSAPTMIGCPELSDKVAAMSLCAMSRMTAKGHVGKNSPRTISPFPSWTDVQESKVIGDCQWQSSNRSGTTVGQRRTKGNLPPKRRLNKAKDTRRDHPSVSYEEMKRLMRVYGPTKCLRNRTPKESGKSTKVLSVKRKFYRWFPDFHERFEVQAPGDWYKPKIGHEREMGIREELRRKDQALLTAKRNAKRNIFKAGRAAYLIGAHDARIDDICCDSRTTEHYV